MNAATTVFKAAIDSHRASHSKWTTSTETHGLLMAVQDLTGIPHFLVQTAVCEKVAILLLKDIADTAEKFLAQNETAARHYHRVTVTDRYGNEQTRTEPCEISTPILTLVDKWIDRIEYGVGNPRITICDKYEIKRRAFLRVLKAELETIRVSYSDEFVDVLKKWCAESHEVMQGGVA